MFPSEKKGEKGELIILSDVEDMRARGRRLVR